MLKLKLMSFLGISLHYINFVAARFCDGGHICSLPRECCTQGCCPPPYQTGPRQLPPPSEHVLNLFFVSHWYFWCVVVAIILAILCAYSLWKKRRTLCGWGLSDLHHAQSEGDSAGSCYAPPQYSRCSSFHHHPPPPYTEVTSKPDLYPLVFTCNTDNGKNGSSYLMVQYFRNYIVRPGGSLSAASTMDSLSSSFICNVNEANTLVPPPYSRAASPENNSVHFQQHATYMPRSASQLVCYGNEHPNVNQQLQQHLDLQQQQQQQQLLQQHQINQVPVHSHTTLAVAEVMSGGRGRQQRPNIETTNLQHMEAHPQSEQHLRYMANSNTSISDIFVNASCGAAIDSGGGGGGGGGGGSNIQGQGDVAGTDDAAELNSERCVAGLSNGRSTTVLLAQRSVSPPYIYKSSASTHALQRASTNPRFIETNRNALMYNSCNSIGGISLAVPVAANAVANGGIDLQMLRRSLETCCQLLQQQQQQQHHHHHQQQLHSHQQQSEQSIHTPRSESIIAAERGESSGGGGGRRVIHEPTSLDEGLRSFVTSSTCSGVSSLANLCTPSSPPQATSPTGEVKEILDQIRQLQQDVSYEENAHSVATPSTARHTISPMNVHANVHEFPVTQLKRFTSLPEERAHNTKANAVAVNPTSSTTNRYNSDLWVAQRSSSFSSRMGILTNSNNNNSNGNTKRPSTLQQTKRKFYAAKPNKAMYIPMRTSNLSPSTSTQSTSRSLLKSPVGSSFFSNRGRLRKGWISRSAPTTPGTTLPAMGDDDSPLLLHHEEDQQGEQNTELD